MKNVEKLVPVAVAGLVLASAGTVDARAEDTTPVVDTNPATSEEEKVESSASSSEIKSATTVTETSGTTEDGTKTTDSIINVDTDGNTVTDEGQVTTQTEVTKTESETTTGTPTSTTTTNSDGSTTTTTTTPTETTTTEESKTEIKGEITPPEDNTPPTDTEKEEVLDDLKDEVKDGWTLDQVKDGDKIGDFTAVGTETTKTDPVLDYATGNTITEETTTVTFETGERTTVENAPLTQDELGVLLGVELTATGENTYTYTQGNTTVTVTLESIPVLPSEEKPDGENVEVTRTKYCVTLSQTKTTTHYKAEDATTDNVGETEDETAQQIITDNDEIEAIFGGLSEEEAAELKSKGTITVNNKTYTYVYDAGEATKIDNLTDEQVAERLPEGYSYTVDGGNYKFFRTVNGETQELTRNAAKDTLKQATAKVTVTVVDHHGGKDDIVNGKPADMDSMQEVFEAVGALEEEAVRKAAQAAAGDAEVTVTKGENGKWTATWTDAEGAHTATIDTKLDQDNQQWGATAKTDVVSAEDYAGSGNTWTFTGSAWVSGDTVVWTETANKDGDGFITGSGTVSATEGELFGTTGETVKSISQDGKTIITEVVDAQTGVITRKTYTFDFNAAFEDGEKEALLAANQTADWTNLKKTSWTVKVQTITPGGNADGFIGDIVGSEGTVDVTVVDENTVRVKENGTEITLVKGSDGKYHNTDTSDEAVYEITDETVPLASYLAELQKKYGDTVSIEGNVITYKDGDHTVTLDYTATKKYTVTKVETTAPETTDPKTSLEDLITELTNIVTNANPGEVYYVNGRALTLDKDGKLQIYTDDVNTETITTSNVIQWIAPNTAINFDALDPADLVKYLQNAKKNDTESERTVGHLELVVSGTLNHEDQTGITDKDKQCVVIPNGLVVKVAESAEDLVYEGQTVDGKTYGDAKQVVLEKQVSWDTQGDGFYQYGRTENQNLGSNANNGQGTSRNPGYYKYQYYRVTGTVAYGEYETISERDYNRKNYTGVAVAVPVPTGEYDWYGRPITRTEYRVYTKTATLDTYGYLGEKSNACTWQHNITEDWKKYQDFDGHGGYRGYDLKLGDLTLLKDGQTVTASGEEVTNYTVELTKRTTTTKTSGSSLKVNALTKDQITSPESDGTGGSLLTGRYEITETRGEEKLKEEDGSWKFEDKEEYSYDTYQTWKDGEKETSEAEGVRYEGSLGFTYQKEDKVVYTDLDDVFDNAMKSESGVTRSASTTRTVAASLSSTSVTRTPGSTTTTTRTPAPYVPPVITPTYDDDDDDDPTPPTVIDEEDVPLAETPETPDVEIPDEEVPMAEEPDVEIPDEEVPLAEVPQTGDNFLLEALALAISSASGLWLGLGKKRRS